VKLAALSCRLHILQIASYQFRLPPWTAPAIEGKIASMISSRCDRHESKQIHGGVLMNGSIGIGRYKGLASLATLLGALFTILLPAYAQQDIAPSWYDPWAAPNMGIAHPAQPPAVAHSVLPLVQNRLQPGDKAPAPRTARLRVKETHLDPSLRNVADKRTETPSGN
jgi:hypothetical protein